MTKRGTEVQYLSQLGVLTQSYHQKTNFGSVAFPVQFHCVTNMSDSLS